MQLLASIERATWGDEKTIRVTSPRSHRCVGKSSTALDGEGGRAVRPEGGMETLYGFVGEEDERSFFF